MRYRVITDYTTIDGTLYSGDLVTEEVSNTKDESKIRVKDSMGRIWFVPKKILKVFKIWHIFIEWKTIWHTHKSGIDIVQ